MKIWSLITRRRHHERQYEDALDEMQGWRHPESNPLADVRHFLNDRRCEECGAPWHGGQWKCTRCGNQSWEIGVGS